MQRDSAKSDGITRDDTFHNYMYFGFFIYIWGIFFHFCSDCQKYFQLKYQKPRQLITEGMMAYSRNMNYFGECLIYAGYCFMSGYLVPFIPVVAVWFTLFRTNMKVKDASMSRYKDWDNYCSQTGFIIPNLITMLKDVPRMFSKSSEKRE